MGTIEFLYGIVLLSMIPVRYEPAEQSEMVTQLLFGDTFTVIEKEGSWLHIKNTYDGYEGWIFERTACRLDEAAYKELSASKCAVVASFNASVAEEGQQPIPIVVGSSLPNYDAESNTFKIGERVFHFEGTVTEAVKNCREEMVHFAKIFLNAPYLWGGKSPYGIDCSGFVQQVGKLVEISLPRDASQQFAFGEVVSFLENVKPGDLAYFDNEDGKIIHVGMLLGKNKIIHASGKVRIDSIDQEGIYNTDIKRYTHHLRAIKSIVKD